jgi:hypothetical protein
VLLQVAADDARGVGVGEGDLCGLQSLFDGEHVVRRAVGVAGEVTFAHQHDGLLFGRAAGLDEGEVAREFAGKGFDGLLRAFVVALRRFGADTGTLAAPQAVVETGTFHLFQMAEFEAQLEPPRYALQPAAGVRQARHLGYAL